MCIRDRLGAKPEYSGISGTLPGSISSLSRLIGVAMYTGDTLFNRPAISGTIPELPSSLEQFATAYSRVSGTVPNGFTNARTLIALGSNWSENVSGSLPASWGSSGKFRSFALMESLVSGTLPKFVNSPILCMARQNFLLSPPGSTFSGTLPALAGMPNLEHLSIKYQEMSGTMPQDLLSTTKLVTVWLAGNQMSGSMPGVPAGAQPGVLGFDVSVMATLSGTLPASFNALAQMGFLSVGNTSVSGTIPSGLASVTVLRNLFTYKTKLSGTIPETFGSMTGLLSLVMSFCPVSGSLPTSFVRLTSLTVMDMSNTRLEGDLDHLVLSNQTSSIHLQRARLSGTLPDFSSAMSIKSILLFGNRISGTLSDDILPTQPRHDGTAANSSLLYLSMSNNRVSGTLPDGICNSTTLKAFTANAMRMSGTLPECLGHLSQLELLSVARNYLRGTLPESMDAMTMLRTLFMFSNRFACNAPHLDGAAQLGAGKFEGLIYPANIEFGKELFVNSGLEFYAEQFSADIDSDNKVLVYTGNSRLTTSASTLADSPVPRSLQKDSIRQGQYGLFSGNSQDKQLWFLMAPAALLAFGTAFTVSAGAARWSRQKAWNRFKKSLSNGWSEEHHVLRRLLKHMPDFLAFSLAVGLSLLILYIAVGSGSREFSCNWEVSVAVLLDGLYPWDGDIREKPQTLQQWLFVFAALLLFKGAADLCFQLRADPHPRRAQRVYRGMLLLAHFECHKSGHFDAVQQWKAAVFGHHFSPAKRRRKNAGPVAISVLAGALHVLLAVVCALPTLFYTMAHNAESSSLAPFRQPVFVVACNALLGKMFLPFAALWLAKLRDVDSVIGFNKLRVNTMYLITFSMNVVAPVLATFLLDENCLRCYLELNPDIRQIMEDWDVAMQGPAAHRNGFCIPKIVSSYGPIWNTTALLGVFVVPSVRLAQRTPWFRALEAWLISRIKTCYQPRCDFKRFLEQEVQMLQSRIVGVLNLISLCIVFGVWVPQLLLFLALSGPIFVLTEELCTALEPESTSSESAGDVHPLSPKSASADFGAEDVEEREKFCQNIVAFIYVPLPAALASTVTLSLLVAAVSLVFLDFGFTLVPQLFFWVLSLSYGGYKLYNHKTRPKPRCEHGDAPCELEINPSFDQHASEPQELGQPPADGKVVWVKLDSNPLAVNESSAERSAAGLGFDIQKLSQAAGLGLPEERPRSPKTPRGAGLGFASSPRKARPWQQPGACELKRDSGAGPAQKSQVKTPRGRGSLRPRDRGSPKRGSQKHIVREFDGQSDSDRVSSV
eukprot:TRINITY_DN7026_c0_g1_i3.p1 TRINITY_DN7026_c0_g1~~TRINITY_DN7026_c0_g1_i3.p1  ORF type:complete len:1285 (+),score=198.37 TRINITY_DN7026_c0_g1_i3:119-3973(+)